MQGLIFDIEEFAVYDGPGIRTAVFFKGCPLRCNWCHNPEGLLPRPQRVVSSLCMHCGKCREVCPTPDHCTACGRCAQVCPRNCIRIAGKYWTSDELAAKLLANAPLLKMNGGGITFSGGECSLQTDFILEVRPKLGDLHCAIETCGHADPSQFCRLITAMDLVLFDIKHIDPVIHKQYTGVDNHLIRQNLNTLIASGIPFISRIPVIPGVNDTEENLTETARWLAGASNLIMVELLPYNKAAGAKYQSVGMTYAPIFDEAKEPRLLTEPFALYNIPVKIL